MDSETSSTRLRAFAAEIKPSPSADVPLNPPETTSISLIPASPYLPTRRELAVFAIFLMLLIFGASYSVLSPTVWNSEYNAHTQSHSQSDPPSYFASKSNVFNKFYVKIGWAWVTAAAVLFAGLSSKLGASITQSEELWLRRVRVLLRYLAVTISWILTTQWCFGPPLIDRSFRLTGGMCHPVEAFSPTGILMQDEFGITPQEVVAYSAVECRKYGGRWHGGHDISGHIFMLVLGAGFLLQEVGWIVWPQEKRAIVNFKGFIIEKEGPATSGDIGYIGKFALGLVGLNFWMLLMTAIFFHTWFEKFTGLLAATVSLYVVYIVPRFIPCLRTVLGVPGLE